MNREEILAKSRNENKKGFDERESAILNRALTISQGVSCLLCVLVMIVNDVCGGPGVVSLGAMTTLWGTFFAERLLMAVQMKGKLRWAAAIFGAVMFIAFAAAFVVFTIRGM